MPEVKLKFEEPLFQLGKITVSKEAQGLLGKDHSRLVVVLAKHVTAHLRKVTKKFAEKMQEVIKRNGRFPSRFALDDGRFLIVVTKFQDGKVQETRVILQGEFDDPFALDLSANIFVIVDLDNMDSKV